MKEILDRLSTELHRQDFSRQEQPTGSPDEYIQIARNYARLENAIAVLSDLKTETSYIYYGKTAEAFGLPADENVHVIHSIWEEEIFGKIHPDDLPAKHLNELRFFHFLKNIPNTRRKNYYLRNKLRMRTTTGCYLPVLHRILYIASHTDRNIRWALCLYNFDYDQSDGCIIVNTANGQITKIEQTRNNGLLSVREKEVLRLIERGMMSKEIAERLSVSVNTINRHRQNIIGKLQVGNSLEACRVAKDLHLI